MADSCRIALLAFFVWVKENVDMEMSTDYTVYKDINSKHSDYQTRSTSANHELKAIGLKRG
ncbi:hypothetical protein HMSSN139_49600 [Paenibacillus sp. HMSSN-139]|nr:hypothetical protein HMSSN139_49600 [Paenibacillus sp. HMSSN-139]